MAHPGVPAPPPSAGDEAATRRSYRFLIVSSVVVWAVFAASAIAAWRHGVASLHGASLLAVLAVATLTLLGWIAFLRGLRRRDLGRIEGLEAPTPRRYDPRSR